MATTIEQIDAWREAKSESERLEFKEAKTQFDFETLADYCVAIANEGGGHLVLGIANKPPRPVVGTSAYPNTGKIAEALFGTLRFRVDVESVNHPEGRVLVFHIPSRPPRRPYEREGRFLMRVHESVHPMTSEQLDRIRTEDVPSYATPRTTVSVRQVIYITATLMLIICFLSFLYWQALHRPRQRDTRIVLPPENHPTTDHPTVTVKRDWHEKQNWRQYLRGGMTRTQVRELFGEPERIRVVSDVESWEYGSGEIKFSINSSSPDGALHSWFEPYTSATHPTPPPTRTYLVLDGNIRFPQDSTGSGQTFSPERNFQIGEPLHFNYFYKVRGANPIQVFPGSRWIYLEPDAKDTTQERIVKEFKQRIAGEWKDNPQFANNYTLMHEADGGQWNTAFAYTEDGIRRSVTQKDLDDFSTGAVRVFVILEIPYKDNGGLHYLRSCQYLVPPATVRGIWHFCDYFTNSD